MPTPVDSTAKVAITSARPVVITAIDANGLCTCRSAFAPLWANADTTLTVTGALATGTLALVSEVLSAFAQRGATSQPTKYGKVELGLSR
jgi:hypothetical protein